MSEQEYTGHVRALRADASFFGAEDFLGLKEDTPLQIVGVYQDSGLKIQGEKSKANFYLKLRDKAGRECSKKMLLNSHRRKMLGLMYGGTTANWKEKWVWIYLEEVRDPQNGGKCLGMRFRKNTSAPAASVHNQQQAVVTDGEQLTAREVTE